MNIEPYNFKYHRKLRGVLIDLNRDLFLIDKKMNEIFVFKDDDYDELHFYIMALEDRRFLQHCGIDFKSIFRVLFKKLTFQKSGGASTIDMQMVRTITGFKEKTFFRKLYEMFLAYIVNFRYSKKKIIDCYLKNAFFGSKLIGIEKVLSSFNVFSLSDLSDSDKRTIAALLQIPKPLNPDQNWNDRISRRSLYASKVRSRVKDSNY